MAELTHEQWENINQVRFLSGKPWRKACQSNSKLEFSAWDTWLCPIYASIGSSRHWVIDARIPYNTTGKEFASVKLLADSICDALAYRWKHDLEWRKEHLPRLIAGSVGSS